MNSEPERIAFTGVVTKSQEQFGMVRDDVFFVKSVVKGPFPQVGDLVLVSAERTTGMPFKYVAKRLQRLQKGTMANDAVNKTIPFESEREGTNIQQSLPKENISASPSTSVSLPFKTLIPPDEKWTTLQKEYQAFEAYISSNQSNQDDPYNIVYTDSASSKKLTLDCYVSEDTVGHFKEKVSENRLGKDIMANENPIAVNSHVSHKTTNLGKEQSGFPSFNEDKIVLNKLDVSHFRKSNEILQIEKQRITSSPSSGYLQRKQEWQNSIKMKIELNHSSFLSSAGPSTKDLHGMTMNLQTGNTDFTQSTFDLNSKSKSHFLSILQKASSHLKEEHRRLLLSKIDTFTSLHQLSESVVRNQDGHIKIPLSDEQICTLILNPPTSTEEVRSKYPATLTWEKYSVEALLWELHRMHLKDNKSKTDEDFEVATAEIGRQVGETVQSKKSMESPPSTLQNNFHSFVLSDKTRPWKDKLVTTSPDDYAMDMEEESQDAIPPQKSSTTINQYPETVNPNSVAPPIPILTSPSNIAESSPSVTDTLESDNIQKLKILRGRKKKRARDNQKLKREEAIRLGLPVPKFKRNRGVRAAARNLARLKAHKERLGLPFM